ncbi:hypothetical protein B0J18DRAFT_203950 [Chaetomium sp. MPI-SDFR-AT-0129]|nr:hypothetical protein B0J18DRAFT_203950 [Chaetomium sp. MPI-SDFR-AT-0129]
MTTLAKLSRNGTGGCLERKGVKRAGLEEWEDRIQDGLAIRFGSTLSHSFSVSLIFLFRSALLFVSRVINDLFRSLFACLVCKTSKDLYSAISVSFSVFILFSASRCSTMLYDVYDVLRRSTISRFDPTRSRVFMFLCFNALMFLRFSVSVVFLFTLQSNCPVELTELNPVDIGQLAIARLGRVSSVQSLVPAGGTLYSRLTI